MQQIITLVARYFTFRNDLLKVPKTSQKYHLIVYNITYFDYGTLHNTPQASLLERAKSMPSIADVPFLLQSRDLNRWSAISGHREPSNSSCKRWLFLFQSRI